MSIIELQYNLIKNIIEIQDISLLSKIKRFLTEQLKTVENTYQLSNKEREIITKRRNNNKQKISNEQVFNEIETWVKEK
ncbi:MAG: hypothetical protein HY738_21370 [Bacteroidia bacterium]|nr:hypothetical protein [Bacteroidia bacterium]